jgi:hypothetical protein
MDLVDDEIHATDCHCLPVEVVDGRMAESPALQCEGCAGVAVDGSWRCQGWDAARRLHEGRFLCRGIQTMGPRVKSVGTQGPASLDPGSRF